MVKILTVSRKSHHPIENLLNEAEAFNTLKQEVDWLLNLCIRVLIGKKIMSRTQLPVFGLEKPFCVFLEISEFNSIFKTDFFVTFYRVFKRKLIFRILASSKLYSFPVKQVKS